MELPRLLAVLDLALLAETGVAVDRQFQRLVEAGVRLFWLRCHAPTGEGLAAVARTLAARPSPVRVVVSEPLRAALRATDHDEFAAGRAAAGLHLCLHDLLTPREFAPSRPVDSVSVHKPSDLRLALAMNPAWLVAAPVWAPHSKPLAGPALGVVGLQALTRETTLPVFALGGITADRAASAVQAGAWGVAALGPLCRPDGPIHAQSLNAAVLAALDPALKRQG